MQGIETHLHASSARVIAINSIATQPNVIILKFREENVPEEADLIDVTVVTPKGERLKCKAYRPIPQGEIPKNPLPSPQYMDLIIRGSIQNGIPDEYLDQLKLVETNHNSQKVPAHEEAMMRLFKRR